MNERVSERQIVDRLRENRLSYELMELQNGVSLIVLERGGRIFGPFLEPGADSLFWVHPALCQEEASRELLANDWNVGGERWWVAPEIQYLCRDRSDYWNSECIQPAMDPGAWRLGAAGQGRTNLRQEMALEVFNLGSGFKNLSMEVTMGRAADPLRRVSDYDRLLDGVVYAGYEQEVTLTEAGRDETRSAAWNTIPLYPPGDMLIQASPRVEVTDYMEAIDGQHQVVGDRGVRLKITGQRRYLTGYKAAHVMGRLGYVGRLDEKRSYLIVRAFHSDPSSSYLDEPPENPGHCGDSVRVYNDDGAYGGYGEMEVYGRGIGGATGCSTSTDRMTLWLYVGEPERLRAIAVQLLGFGWD